MKLSPKLRKIRHYSLIVIMSVVLILIVGAFTPSKWFYDTSKSCDVNIYVINGGFHSDIIIPVKTEVFDWNDFIPLEDIGTDSNQQYKYLSFGWGERDFYVNTPTVADIKIQTVIKALFYPNNTAVMHVQGYDKSPNVNNSNIKSVGVSYDDYLKLAKFIQNYFKVDKSCRVNRIANGYRPQGGFHDARGTYSIFRDCNNWTADALKLADVNTPVWSTLSAPIMWHLRSHCGAGNGEWGIIVLILPSIIKIMPKKRPENNKFIEPPELPQVGKAEILAEGQLDELESYENIWVSNCKLTGAREVTINKAYFQNVQISDAQFPCFDLSDIRFEKCDLANTECHKASLNKVELIGCRLLGFQITKSHVKDTLIKDCHGKFAQFEFTKFKGVRFENCSLEDTNFQDADLSNAVFLNCDLRNTMLSGAKLTGADFRGSNIENLDVKLEQLRDAIFDPLQAIYLLQRYAGAVVKDSDDGDVKL